MVKLGTGVERLGDANPSVTNVRERGDNLPRSIESLSTFAGYSSVGAMVDRESSRIDGRTVGVVLGAKGYTGVNNVFGAGTL